MAFHDVRLPENIERGAIGGPGFLTTIQSVLSGLEKRNIQWSQARGEWDIGYGITKKVDYDAIIAFFYPREGMAHSFRFKDWSDFELPLQVVMTTDTSTDTVTVFKRYASGGINYDRPLTKIVASSVSVWVNSISQTVVEDTPPAAGEVRIDLLTGLLTLGSTHVATSGLDVEVVLEFDVAVRFGTDKLNINITVHDIGSVPSISLVEVKDD